MHMCIIIFNCGLPGKQMLFFVELFQKESTQTHLLQCSRKDSTEGMVSLAHSMHRWIAHRMMLSHWDCFSNGLLVAGMEWKSASGV